MKNLNNLQLVSKVIKSEYYSSNICTTMQYLTYKICMTMQYLTGHVDSLNLKRL